MTDADTVMEVVRQVIAEILPALPPEAITGDKHLRELGADSVDRVEIILGVQRRLRVDIPLSSFGELPDLDAMIALLSEESGS